MHRMLASACSAVPARHRALLAQDAPPRCRPKSRDDGGYQKPATPGDAHAAMAKMAGSYPVIRTGTARFAADRRDPHRHPPMALNGRVLVEEMRRRCTASHSPATA